MGIEAPASVENRWPQWFQATPVKVFKNDGRSRVWQVESSDPPGPIILKQFTFNHLRQRFGWLTGLHPAYQEIRQSRRLIRDGLPVVPIWGSHVELVGLGCQITLACPYQGLSLYLAWRRGRFAEAAIRDEYLARLSQMLVTMIQAGWSFRDLKTSNILCDDDNQPWLIDIGSARKVRPVRSGHAGMRIWRMLRVLDQSMTADGWALEHRLACLARPLACICADPVAQAYDRLARIVLK